MSTQQLYTGHEVEMAAEAESEAAWAAKPLAERQIDMIRSRLESALDMINSIGQQNLFGEIVTASDAAESAIHNISEALRCAKAQK